MKKTNLDNLLKVPYFSKNILRNITDESNNTLNVSVRRLLKRGELVKLKNGYYTTKNFFEKNGHLTEYRELVAGALCQPSYLSTEYVLSKYDMMTEGVLAYTSVSLKTTRDYENKLGSFLYKKISDKVFFGYKTKYWGKNSYQIATKAKALFDYLYLRTDIILKTEKSFDIIKENRIRIDLIDKHDWKEMKKYLKEEINRKTEAIKLALKPYAPNF